MKASPRNSKFRQKRMEHALAEIPRVDRSAVTRLKNATGFPIREMVMKQFRKLRVDIDDAFSVFRLGRLLDSFDDAAANVNHTVGDRATNENKKFDPIVQKSNAPEHSPVNCLRS